MDSFAPSPGGNSEIGNSPPHLRISPKTASVFAGDILMAIALNELKDGKIIEVAVTGRLTDADYQRFIPEFERMTSRYKKIRLLFEMSQFHGWDVKAAWDDLKLGAKHYGDVERIAMIGEEKWQEWMARFSKPFTAAEVRYFDKTAAPAALTWLEEGLGPRI
jgi:hypothetical protein